jgi:hypothetical protein
LFSGAATTKNKRPACKGILLQGRFRKAIRVGKKIIKMTNQKSTTLEAPTGTLANFNAGFYNAFVAALKLDPTQFQLTQGAFALPNVSTSLYNVFDGVPPISACNLWTANSLNTVSGNFENLLGYASAAEMQGFTYKVASSGFLNTTNWVGGTVGSDPLYAPTVAAIGQALMNGSSATVNYDSSTADTSLSDVWSKSASAGGVWFWGSNNDSTSESLNTAASSSDVSITMNLKYATVPIQQGPWLNSGYLSQMYKNPNSWATPSEWDTLFGANGSFQYVNTQALIITDFDITITSKASYSASQYYYVSSNSDINVWPFYTSSESSSTTTHYTQNADSSITATIKSDPGAVQIMGFNVISLAQEMTT